MKIDNLHQEHDAEAPYADSLVLDAGGMNINLGGDPLAYVSFEGLDPFELAYHTMPADWERHESRNGAYFGIDEVQFLENETYALLTELGKVKGWERN